MLDYLKFFLLNFCFYFCSYFKIKATASANISINDFKRFNINDLKWFFLKNLNLPIFFFLVSVSNSGGHFSTYGEDEVLTCSLSNAKTGDIDYLMWRKISPSVVLKRTSHVTSLQLHLKHVNETDAGVYQCVFHSKNGYSFFMKKTVEIKGNQNSFHLHDLRSYWCTCWQVSRYINIFIFLNFSWCSQYWRKTEKCNL